MSDHAIAVKVSPGQFDDEFAITGVQANGDAFSLFAPRDLVEVDETALAGKKEAEGTLRVSLVECKDGNCVVILPQHTLETMKSYVVVNESNIRELAK